MGLDMYIYRIKKAKLEDREYTAKELRELGLSFTTKECVYENANLYAQLLPYTVERKVSDEFINKEKIIEDYNLPKNSRIWMRSYEGIKLCGTDDNGNDIDQYVTREEIEKKYVKTETESYFIWDESEVAYWRKHYDLQDWIYDAIDGVDNTGYYILDAETIREINRVFEESIPREDPTDEEALFYWEWY